MGGFEFKRFLLAFAIILAIWMVWAKLFLPKAPPPGQQAAAPAGDSGAAVPAEAQPKPSPPPPTTAQAPKPAEQGGSKPSAPQAANAPAEASRPPESKVTLEAQHWRATLTSYGAAIAAFEVKDGQYKESNGSLLDLVHVPEHPALSTWFAGKRLPERPDAAWQLESSSARDAVFVWQGDGVRLTKRYRADDSAPYLLWVTLEVRNAGAAPLETRLQMRNVARHDFSQKSGLFQPAPNLWQAACYVDAK